MENNIKIERKGEKTINFLKKYGYFIVAGLIVVAITLTILLTTTKASIVNEGEENVIDTGSTAIVFQLPLLDCTVATDYSVDKVLYNKTLGWFETHSAVDLTSTTSNDVLSAYSGTVSDVYTNSLEGTVVIIKHNDTYSTLYGSLDNVTVSVGDTITTGQKLGTISTSAGNESLTGAHLHFQVLKDNSDVNPNDYLELGNK